MHSGLEYIPHLAQQAHRSTTPLHESNVPTNTSINTDSSQKDPYHTDGGSVDPVPTSIAHHTSTTSTLKPDDDLQKDPHLHIVARIPTAVSLALSRSESAVSLTALLPNAPLQHVASCFPLPPENAIFTSQKGRNGISRRLSVASTRDGVALYYSDTHQLSKISDVDETSSSSSDSDSESSSLDNDDLEPESDKDIDPEVDFHQSDSSDSESQISTSSSDSEDDLV